VRPSRLALDDGGSLDILCNVSECAESVRYGSRVSVSCEIPAHRTSLVRTDRDRKVLALEACGRTFIDNTLVAESDGPFALCSLDGQDIRASESVALLLLECTKLRLYGGAWNRRIIELGDIHEGSWRQCVRPQLHAIERGISFAIPEELSLDMGVISSPQLREQSTERICLWMNRPDHACRVDGR